MRTRYRHIHFIEWPFGDTNGKKAYLCRNNRGLEDIGKCTFYPAWRKYVFEGHKGCVFDSSCLADIIHFMGLLDK
ncbi:MAG: hypothetical protein GWN55_07445 [Phycisphaerae bacterium]|nr:hypothetical protein [Phycisphaerae bacterium]NIP55680.1 hypothetical protein [Phycisphaerae bacterium]NIS50777.1 hypothetical protein [Phycisphaerae bacterium]NIV01143.1 hypothetical protein [Phycisphaerae bacterium]NIV70764.1 hypothetical protein [Phycisphaerae bacterium]